MEKQPQGEIDAFQVLEDLNGIDIVSGVNKNGNATPSQADAEEISVGTQCYILRYLC